MRKTAARAGTTGHSIVHWVRQLVARLARRGGYYISRNPDELLYEEHLRRLLSSLKINCVLDVGSHMGDFGRLLRHIGYAGLIISFEPVADNFQVLLERSEGDPKWYAHRLALGTTKGNATITVFSGTTFHSFLPSSEHGRERFPSKMLIERTEVVPIERLENILSELVDGIADPKIFLKVDVQGYDLEVIKGLGAAVSQISALQVELAFQSLYDNATNLLVDAVPQLEKLGFQVAGMFPVTYEADGVRLLEVDCLMARPTGVQSPSAVATGKPSFSTA